jgi:uncharacterized protein YjiS (DUF1127 family)
MTTTTMVKTLRRPHLEAKQTLFMRIFRGPMVLVAAIQRWHGERIAVRQMSALTDAQLRDIGIHRSQIHFISSNPSKTGSRRHAYYSD